MPGERRGGGGAEGPWEPRAIGAITIASPARARAVRLGLKSSRRQSSSFPLCPAPAPCRACDREAIARRRGRRGRRRVGGRAEAAGTRAAREGFSCCQQRECTVGTWVGETPPSHPPTTTTVGHSIVYSVAVPSARAGTGDPAPAPAAPRRCAAARVTRPR